ncbi:type I DNA topoisomerase [Acidithiobacillus ferridurans]|uniref:DNA topoisomerase 1 n=2 Tax=Acidithiobacillus ferridurans TaxID=1232575 RepID=A0A8X8K9J7_ACIFI|nr:type I DNA topoisomerase [Acidithiobacillus ferridurans]MBU2717370.1 type I DNA topoisomerase [Acidithiobacillus ferridurans]MBU2722961.1 type I DNA topoisomerase [Acidithiobacillus ferridurans]MBU2726770.1 type I DNA topoisomerase [Acidithiobacillus ferridurans]
MAHQLVIVESPAKAKTIQKYLGDDFQVLASYGHVRDLQPKEGAVDTERDFAMRYTAIERNERHVDAIAKALRGADKLWLATDPDREGEAISWHLVELLRERHLLGDKPTQRVVFHEITKKAVQEAIAHPREIAMDLVNAQQARRALDYLVGFNLSPLLWRKVRPGLSAGRVQSAALRLICERENEIEAFVSREYWTIASRLQHAGSTFTARLTHWQNKKLEQFDIADGDQAQAIRSGMEDDLGHQALRVREVERKSRQRQPAAPFTTSTLQQEASRKLGFNASRTMRVAQQLYEGINIGNETVGLISYMRTDAVNLAEEAIASIRTFIDGYYGSEFVPETPRRYKTKTKNAQEAHEAIRPTDIARTPESLQGVLERDLWRLYELVWKRSIACQMAPARLDLVAVDMDAGTHWTLRANGSMVTFPGFMAVYQEGKDDGDEDENNRILPPLDVGDEPQVLGVDPEQHFTEPPPRYSDATLVKTLEAHGIGRPSTYASIIQTLQNREYVAVEQRRFHPTDLGRVVGRFLTNHFERYVDYGFTASMEDELDAVSRGEKQWQPVLSAFWSPFRALLDEKANVSRAEATSEALEEACPQCGKPLFLRLGRHGRFVACSGYPECNYTRPVDGPREPAEPVGRDCPDCGKPLVYKTGRYGRFISCSGYPECKHIEPLTQPKSSGVTCPQCGEGELVEKRSRYGKVFYSCNTYPKCTYAVWGPPVARPCPRCGWPIMIEKSGKRLGEQLACPQSECAFHFPVNASDAEIAAMLPDYTPPPPREKRAPPAKRAARARKTTAKTAKKPATEATAAAAKKPAKAKTTTAAAKKPAASKRKAPSAGEGKTPPSRKRAAKSVSDS